MGRTGGREGGGPQRVGFCFAFIIIVLFFSPFFSQYELLLILIIDFKINKIWIAKKVVCETHFLSCDKISERLGGLNYWSTFYLTNINHC